MITGRLRPVIKLVLGFGFDFGDENQITYTRSNQHAFGKVLLAYENGATRRASVNSPGRASQAMNTPGRAPQREAHCVVWTSFSKRKLAEVGEIISRFEKKGFYLKGLKFLNVDRAFAEKHYHYSW
ncbi:hypothetical protein QL285_057368 [Trifolium repens]|nr:hypothetical protein QL285_057368 [Trifolium repens]